MPTAPARMSSCRSATLLGSGTAAVLAIALGLATLPNSEPPVDALVSHAKLLAHLFGLRGIERDGRYGMSEEVLTRPPNGTLREVQGFVSKEVFREKYLWKDAVVFRGGATPEFGFDLGCLTEGVKTDADMRERLVERSGDTKFRVFTDQYNDASVEWLTMAEYIALVDDAIANGSKPMPYARAYSQSSLTCKPVPSEQLALRRSWGGWACARFLPEPDTSQLFVSFTQGTNTKMHMDVGDSIFTQVYGRKRWLLIDRSYATKLKIYGDHLNLVYIAGYDVHREPLPNDVYVEEVILGPGDVLYFPGMTLHSAYNLDPVTIGIDNVVIDLANGFLRHWLLTATTAFNPRIVYRILKQLWYKGGFKVTDLYFDTFGEGKGKVSQAKAETGCNETAFA